MNTRTHSQSWHEVRTGARQCGGCADRHPVSCGQPRSFSILFLPPSTPPLQGASTFSDSVILRLSFLGETRFRDALQIPALTSYTFESRKTRRPARLFLRTGLLSHCSQQPFCHSFLYSHNPYFSRIFLSAVVNLIGLPYISVPNRKIFAASTPAPTQNTASSAPEK